MKLTNKQWSIIIAALHVAASQYDKDAKAQREEKQLRLATQFEVQAMDARAVAERVEASDLG